jgi:hypothetical protein
LIVDDEKVPEELVGISPARLKRWAELGVDRVEADLVHHGGVQVVGGPPEVQDQARRWVRYEKARVTKAGSEPKLGEAVIFRPTIYGIGIDPRKLWAWLKRKFRG